MKKANLIAILLLISLSLLVACKPKVMLGEVKKNDEGGYSFQLIPGYSFSANGAQVLLTAPNATMDSGPLYMLNSTSDLPEGTTLDMLISGMIGSPSNAKIESLEIQGLECKAIEITETSSSPATVTKFLFCLQSATRGFMLAGTAPQDLWEREGGQYFDPLVKSLTFFEPLLVPTQQP